MRANPLATLASVATSLLLAGSCIDDADTPSADLTIALDGAGPVIAYSGQYNEWGSDVHLIAEGDDYPLFTNDTVARAWPSLDRAGKRVAYVKDGVAFPMYGWQGNPALVVADIPTQTEDTILPAAAGVRYWYPVWTGIGTIALNRTSGDTSEVLVVEPSGAVLHRLPIGPMRQRDWLQTYEIDGHPGLVAMCWADSVAILDAAAGELRGRAGDFYSIVQRPFSLGDSLYLPTAYSNYRVYNLTTFGFVDRLFTLDIDVSAEDTMWHVDSARVVAVDDSTRVIYQPGTAEHGERVLVCDTAWSLRGIYPTLLIENFLGLFNGSDIHYVAHMGNDTYVVVRQNIRGPSGSSDYDVLSTARANFFITDARIYP